MPERIDAKTLKAWLAAGENVRIVDVRDGDHIGGHIRSSVNYPSTSFTSSLASLKGELKGAKKVVFYCQLSQQRGPTCAAYYEEHAPAPSSQAVYVLNGGFQNWAYTYGPDSSLTDKFMPDLYP